jgi:hypothetical protein
MAGEGLKATSRLAEPWSRKELLSILPLCSCGVACGAQEGERESGAVLVVRVRTGYHKHLVHTHILPLTHPTNPH